MSADRQAAGSRLTKLKIRWVGVEVGAITPAQEGLPIHSPASPEILSLLDCLVLDLRTCNRSLGSEYYYGDSIPWPREWAFDGRKLAISFRLLLFGFVCTGLR